MEPIKPCLLRLPALLGLLLRQISRATHWLYSIAHGSNRHTGINLECASWRNTRLSIIEVILAGRCDAGELLRLMRAVDGRLSTIAGSGYFNSELQVLQTEWKDFADAVQQLVWDSRELAGEAQAIASDFLQVFLQRLEDHAIPFDDKLLELRDYLKEFEKQAVKPKRIASAFGTLTQRLDLYIKKCSTLLVESHHTHHHSEIVTILDQVRDILRTSEICFDERGVLFIIASITPSIRLEGKFIPRYILSHDLESLRPNKDPIELSTRMLAICSISTAIRVDFRRLEKHMDANRISLANDAGNFQSFQDELTGLKDLYETLIGALAEYQIAIVPNHA